MKKSGGTSEKPEVIYSVSPAGEKFELPKKRQYGPEYMKLAKRVKKARSEGKEIYTLYNGTGHTFYGDVLARELPSDQHVVDLLRGEEAEVDQQGGPARMRLFLPREEVELQDFPNIVQPSVLTLTMAR